MSVELKHYEQRLSLNAGIAIGPILFIIAVLGILASAIAAGSGSFTTGTTGESNRAKATALIDIGQNLKLGFDRIIGNGIEFDNVVIDETKTDGDSDLFSPNGGGITAPSRTMGETPSTDEWMYPLIVIPGIGTSSGQRVAVIKVSEGVCDEINKKTIALDTGTAKTEHASLGDFSGDETSAIDNSSSWPASFEGKPVGCVYNDNGTTTGYFYYQVIGVQ
ncbi:MAG: hypothetical protein AB7E52_04425 [Bdellovibrionales bacterium]